MDTINKLQFKHHSEIITGATLPEAREAVLKYLYDQWFDTAAYNDPNSDYRSLYAEPTVFRYAVEGEEADPHIILMIGADTNDGSRQEYNKFCIIDIDKTEQEIADLAEELEKAIKSLTVIALSSDTLNLYADKTEDGTYVSGDVKTARYHMFGDDRMYNNLMVTSASDEGPEGIFIYVDLTYDEASESFTFVVTNADGTLKETTVTLPNNYLVSGRYSVQDQSLHLGMRNGDDVVVDCKYLIAEWDTERELSRTPIVLTKEEVGYGEDAEYFHLEPWQDVLRADIRLRDEIKDEETGKYVKDPNSTNILNRTTNGQYLYVDGKASNIIYYWEGEKSNVKDQLDKLNQIKVSQDNDNIIWNRVDGFFASTKLDYITNKNQLVFTTTNVSGGTVSKTIQLNTVELFQNIYYDPTTEELVLTYKDGEGNLKVVRIPIGQMLDEWDVLNEGHSVQLVKKPHQVSGKDILTADVKISDGENNILLDRNHALYVRGTADNIKYGEGTVKDALDGLISEDETLNQKIEAETARAEAAEQVLDNKIDEEQARAEAAEGALDAKIDQETADREADVDEEQVRAEAAEQELTDKIGTGFTSDPHENVTYKFEQLTDRVATEEARAAGEEARIEEKLDSEIARATEKDVEHDEKLAEQQAEIEAISADSASSIKDVINIDHSIYIDKSDATKPVLKVNLSEHEPYNTIRLEGDGLYNFIDLNYDPDTNKLTFTRSENGSTENKSKEIQLNSVPFDITYDKNREVLIITYHTSEGEKTVEIDLHDLIHDEWEVYNDPNSAVKLDKSESVSGTDILSAEVVLSPRSGATVDNIIENVNGALYVPANNAVTTALSGAIDAVDAKVNAEEARAIAAESSLQNAIDSEGLARDSAINEERTRAISAETALSGAISTVQTNLQTEVDRATATEARIETALNNEISRAQTKESALDTAITNETIRANQADNELYQSIADETASRISADANLQSQINQEASRAQVAETTISERLGAEINRSTLEDQTLRDLIATETAARQDGDAGLQQMIDDATLTFDDTNSIDFTKSSENVVTASVKLQEGDNIIKVGSGLYASVNLSYDPATNKIKLVTSNGETEPIQLVGASLLEDLRYDPVNKALVITYKDATGEEHTVSFGVSELFNEWNPYNPSEDSAIELTKTPATEPGGEDKLSGRVLLTNLEDNAVKIVNNGLYVSASAMTGAEEIAKCAKAELKGVEKAVIGYTIADCDSGYTYEPWTVANYISGATSFNNADFILDQSIKNVENKVDDVIEDVNCVDSSAKKLYELLYGQGTSMPDCGEGVVYTPDLGSCVISAATSFMDADKKLGDQLCEILEMWVSGMTCTTLTDWVDEGANKKMLVDVRLSHGNSAAMSDDDLTTVDLNGVYIDPTDTEFTDTNALRIVCLQEGGGGVTPDVRSKQNGIYLSNVWDCGLYYGPGDTEAKAKAEEAGYNTNYSTDEDASASGFNYMNNVRQHDV